MLGGRKSLIIFDLDGTLVDTVPDIAVALNAALAEFGRSAVTAQQVRGWVGDGAGALCRRALADRGGVDSERLLQRFLAHYAERACADSRVYDGVVNALEDLHARKLHLACVTNKPLRHTGLLLGALGLRRFFGKVLGGDSLPRRKPDPLPIRACLDHYDVKPEGALVVGDSANDVNAARAAGVDSVAVTYGYNQGRDVSTLGANLLVDALTQLPQHLA